MIKSCSDLEKRWPIWFNNVSVFNRRGIRIFIPFFLLLISFSAFYFAQNWGTIGHETVENLEGTPTPSNLIVRTTAVPTSIPTPIQTENEEVSSSGTSQDNDTSILTESSDHIPIGEIQLIGPPINSVFSLATPLTVYWNWSTVELDGTHFSLYIQDDVGEYLAGTVDESSLGNMGYQINFLPEEIINSEGPYFIIIRLQQNETLATLDESEPRAINFITAISG